LFWQSQVFHNSGICPKPARKIPNSKPALVIAPDLDQRLAKFKPIQMSFHTENLTPESSNLFEKLVEACNDLEQIYWRQSDPEGLKLYVSLSTSKKPEDQKLLRFLKINGSRYDLIDELKPFVGTNPAPPGRALFPRYNCKRN